jgi:putative CocE/NonD family hydrolase
VPEILEQIGEAVEMTDGTILRADVYRPDDTVSYPVLMLRTPYGRRDDFYVGSARRLAEHGYVVVTQDIRGRFDSDGEFFWQFGPEAWTSDAQDGYDTVEWCARLPLTTGQVGTYGHSYDSWVQWELARLQPPSLTAMFAGGMTARATEFTQGILETGRRMHWVYMLGASDRYRNEDVSVTDARAEAERIWEQVEGSKWVWRLPLSSIPDYVFGSLTEQFQRYLAKQHNEEDGEQWDFYPTHPLVNVPVCLITGWWDRVVRTTRHYPSLLENANDDVDPSKHRLVVGPWSHASRNYGSGSELGDLSFGPQAARAWEDMIVDWFDFVLKGTSNHFAEGPVQVFLVGSNRWISLDAWPPSGSSFLELYLHSTGSANEPGIQGELSKEVPGDEPSDHYTYDPSDPVMSIITNDAQAAPLDQSALRNRWDIVAYDTQTFEETTFLIGDVELLLWVGTTAPDTDFIAKLVLVQEDGFAVNLSYGAVRLSLVGPVEESASTDTIDQAPARLYRIDMRSLALRVKPGQRIRLMITSSDFPNLDRNHNTGAPYWSDPELRIADQTIYHDKNHMSVLRIPLMGQEPASLDVGIFG